MALTLSTTYAGRTLPQNEDMIELLRQAREAATQLEDGTGPGAEMRGWLHFPGEFLRSPEYRRLRECAEQIQETAELLIVIGIGGSYLGARAVIEACLSRYHNDLQKTGPRIYFAGNSLSEVDLLALTKLVHNRDFAINVISKSGATLEPAVTFRYFKQLLKDQWKGNETEINKRIYVTTDGQKGALLTEAKEKGWTCFVVPDDMGGRYSVLSPVGLLPIVCAGVDSEALLQGAHAAEKAYGAPIETLTPAENPCLTYAALRHYFYRKNKRAVEIFASFEPGLTLFGEWWKQLFGESEGKNGSGLFPASCTFTTDLHSMGQYIQSGERLLFETIVRFQTPRNNLSVEEDNENRDGLNYLAGKTFHEINDVALEATATAHRNGDCPCLLLELPRLDAHHIGWLIYFFEKACAVSGYLNRVNPFDQEGVEDYKKIMFSLLGKPKN